MFTMYLIQVLSLYLLTGRIIGYELAEEYSGSSFFGGFSFFTDPDPTHGFVQYVDEATASMSGLTNMSSGPNGEEVAYIGVDSTTITTEGRSSVRIVSKNTYNHGLIIADIAHMPGSICGTWPAFWMVGPNWPWSGEIDIIEGVNDQQNNFMTFHTSAGCSMVPSAPGTGLVSGILNTLDCDVNALSQGANEGCQTAVRSPASYGDGLNAAGGGVYATEWTSQAIKIWFFSRATGIPQDILDGEPNPDSWGIPEAELQQDCDIDAHFKDLRIVFDSTFCGDWAGAAWQSAPACAVKAATCEAFVANNPEAFKEAYWEINYVRVFEQSVEKVVGEVSCASH